MVCSHILTPNCWIWFEDMSLNVHNLIICFAGSKKELKAVYQAQRDLIVKLLIYAAEFKIQSALEDSPNNNSITSRNKSNEIINERTKHCDIENFKIYMDDMNLPPKSILKAEIKKKNKSLGWETRYIILGFTQLLSTKCICLTFHSCSRWKLYSDCKHSPNRTRIQCNHS